MIEITITMCIQREGDSLDEIEYFSEYPQDALLVEGCQVAVTAEEL